ncbi:RabGAP/TBC domain-containing protein [Cavenderia fasciculata]|uniref:RabGAP/TBC domain-containing protein n=1 Tax=Cavenderia fasciculata TaxID=261658 RepID=F4PZL4_CACFS|nr:RabGAP/TBC domain-containing protein [Cavenderia fasciculata]EGG18778.1 RabGAP/TBC domain-containing protein [Cavenderia fasciculata]|eukprot:XP_004357240.1 RabGAP/TBC domain-containing protein [Cavenderia fasciculata]
MEPTQDDTDHLVNQQEEEQPQQHTEQESQERNQSIDNLKQQDDKEREKEEEAVQPASILPIQEVGETFEQVAEKTESQPTTDLQGKDHSSLPIRQDESSDQEEEQGTSPKSGSILKFIESTRGQPSRDQTRKRTFTIGSRGTPTISLSNEQQQQDTTTTIIGNQESSSTASISIITTSTTNGTGTTFLSTSPSPSTSPNSTTATNLLSNHRSTSNEDSPLSSPSQTRKKKVQKKVTINPDDIKPDGATNDYASQDNIIVTIGNGEDNYNTLVKDGMKRDIHGFIVDDFYEELKKFQVQEELMSKQRLEKWTAFNEHYKHVGLCSNPKQLHKLLSHGIPHGVRNVLWKIYSGAGEKQRKEEIELFKQQKEERLKSRLNGMGTIRGLNPPANRKSYYQHLHQIIRSSNRISTRLQSTAVEIDKDIERTFPGHPFFESDEGKRKLTRVLQAYSVRNRKVGYCQSMNIVAGYLLIWDHLFVECGIYGFHKPSQESKWLEEDIILNDKLNQPFKCQGLASYNLLLTALAILSYLEESLLKTNSTPELLTILSNNCKGIFDAKRFFKKYYKWRDRINEESFIESKKVSEINLIQELEEMRKLRDLRSTSKITRFSKGELEKIWDGFRNLNLGMGQRSRVSMGKSLKLDFDIFKKVFSYILPTYDTSAKEVIIQQLFKIFDKNKDGCLDFSELMSGLCILAKGTSEERLQLYFSFFDSDNSGFVTKEEMKLMLQTAYEKIDLDPLAVTQSSIDDYVDVVFSNLGISNNSLSFDDFRRAILSYPRIFKCFMLEEETFTIEDFEMFDESDTVKSNVNTPPLVDNVNNNNDIDNNIQRGENNLKTSDGIKNNNETNNNSEPTTTTNDSNNSLQNHPLLNTNITYTKPKSNTGSNTSINSNNGNNSNFKSTLIQAIEQAQMEKEPGVKHQTISSSNETVSTSSSAAPSENSATAVPAPSSSPSPSSAQTDRSRRLSRAVEPEGAPLSCCKFM